MTVNITLLTHKAVGEELINAVTHTLGQRPNHCDSVSVTETCGFDSLITTLRAHIDKADDGLLILTDLYGSTPCNVAKALSEEQNCAVVTGLNLPMLLKTINYQHLDVEALAAKALEGGKECIKKV